MNKIITTIALGIFLINMVSALDLQAGESHSFELAEEFAYYSIVGNSTEVYLDVVQEGTLVTITPDKYVDTDSFSLIFFNTEKEVITVYRGGGTRTVYEDRDVIEYKDRDVIKYIDKEVEVPGETELIERTEVVKEGRTWAYVVVSIISIIAGFLGFVLLDYFRNKEEPDNHTPTHFNKEEDHKEDETEMQ